MLPLMELVIEAHEQSWWTTGWIQSIVATRYTAKNIVNEPCFAPMLAAKLNANTRRHHMRTRES